MKKINFVLFLTFLFSSVALAGNSSLPLQKLSALCVNPLTSPVYGLWQINKVGCPNTDFRNMLSEFVIVLPGNTPEELDVYLSDTKDFMAFQNKTGSLLDYGDLYVRVNYPFDAGTFYDLVMMSSEDGSTQGAWGFKNWIGTEAILFGDPGGNNFGCNVSK